MLPRSLSWTTSSVSLVALNRKLLESSVESLHNKSNRQFQFKRGWMRRTMEYIGQKQLKNLTKAMAEVWVNQKLRSKIEIGFQYINLNFILSIRSFTQSSPRLKLKLHASLSVNCPPGLPSQWLIILTRGDITFDGWWLHFKDFYPDTSNL